MTDDEIQNVRARVHRLADTVQAHEVMIGKHSVLIETNAHGIDKVREEMSTRDQLTSAVDKFALQLEIVHADLDPIRRGIFWVIGLVLASVITGLLALVLRHGPPV